MSLRVGLLMDDAYDLDLIRADLPGIDIERIAGWREDPSDRLAERLRAYDALVTGRKSPRLPEELVADRGRLRLLAHCHGTIKHLASKAHLEAGLLVSNWGDQVAGVAEGALALLLACLKQLRALDACVRSGWQQDARIHQDVPGSLIGARVGLYGFGPIGRHMGRMLLAIGARPAIYDPYATALPEGIGRCASLRELFATCPFVSIHCGLNAGTENSVDAALLALLPQGGILVNTARGGVVVEEDLAAALASGRILAGIDVIRDEKAWTSGPLAAIGSDRLILSGHIIGRGKGPDPAKPAPPRSLPAFVCGNLRALVAGAPLRNLVTAAEYDLKT